MIVRGMGFGWWAPSLILMTLSCVMFFGAAWCLMSANNQQRNRHGEASMYVVLAAILFVFAFLTFALHFGSH